MKYGFDSSDEQTNVIMSKNQPLLKDCDLLTHNDVTTYGKIKSARLVHDLSKIDESTDELYMQRLMLLLDAKFVGYKLPSGEDCKLILNNEEPDLRIIYPLNEKQYIELINGGLYDSPKFVLESLTNLNDLEFNFKGDVLASYNSYKGYDKDVILAKPLKSKYHLSSDSDTSLTYLISMFTDELTNKRKSQELIKARDLDYAKRLAETKVVETTFDDIEDLALTDDQILNLDDVSNQSIDYSKATDDVTSKVDTIDLDNDDYLAVSSDVKDDIKSVDIADELEF